jgi:hypothetical protein
MDQPNPVNSDPHPLPELPDQPVKKSVFDPGQVYPDATANSISSPMPAVESNTFNKNAEPGRINHTYGVTIMAVLLILSAAFSLTRASATTIAQIAAALDILLAVGLLFRVEVARKIIIYLLSISLVLQLISIPVMISTLNRATNGTAEFDRISQQEQQKKITPGQRQALDNASANLHANAERVNKLYGRVYLSLGILIVVEIAEIVYLTRPKVKSVFH